MKRNVSIYACGGLGCNLLKALPIVTEQDIGLANVSRYYIDTSMSNLHDLSENDKPNTYLFEGIDGSGKIRKENHELISKSTLSILQEMKPEDFSILISSASGGSGSMISSAILSELLKRNKLVVSIVVGSTNSHIEIENTIKTLKTYDNISAKLNKTIAVHYLENSRSIKREEVDKTALSAVIGFLTLFSGNNAELDTADLKNWLHHDKLNHQVYSLQFCVSEEGYHDAGNVVTVATLAKTGVDTYLNPRPAYQCVGYINEKAISPLFSEILHVTLSSDLIDKTNRQLNEMFNETETHLKSIVKRNSLVSETDIVSDNGSIL